MDKIESQSYGEPTREEGINYILSEFDKIEIKISKKQAEQFYEYYSILVEKNKVMNLTTITEFKDVVLKHFLDSVEKTSEIFGEDRNATLIDVGTGAGFPGIPLKIIYPEMKITLLDSLNKRILFLNEVIEKLDLKMITTVHSRAEDAAHNKNYREKYHYCVSRAVANLSTLSEYCIPFVEQGGAFISYKSGNVKDEINAAQKAIRILGCEMEKQISFELLDSEMKRSILCIKKINKTPRTYPRKAGIPSREPLSL